MLPTESIQCPYCGESIDIAIDDSVDRQQYVEDCQVCCRPINIVVTVEEDGATVVQAWAENEV
ncbi:MAG TPA: CPXCG motif-containing cysteine-rich protein [Pseudoxanthomonas sp.]